MESLDFRVVAVLMFFEIKHHSVPHLKSFTRSIDHSSANGHGSIFKQRYTVLKRFILLNKWAK